MLRFDMSRVELNRQFNITFEAAVGDLQPIASASFAQAAIPSDALHSQQTPDNRRPYIFRPYSRKLQLDEPPFRCPIDVRGRPPTCILKGLHSRDNNRPYQTG
jgi:hypothetical protein